MPSERARAVFLAIGLAFLASRTYDLTGLPLFVDESKHLWWSKRLRTEAGFLKPLEDGKLLQVAVDALATPWAADPVWAGRFASVVAGGFGLWAAWRIGRRVYDETTGLTAAALYAACPFALVYDRMNLADVYVSSLSALALLASLDLAERPRAGAAVALGLALAGAVLAKAPGLLAFPIPLVAAWLLGRRSAGLGRRVALAYALAAAWIAFPLAYFLTRTSQIGAKARSAPDRLDLVLENVGTAAVWLWTYWTPPLVVAGGVAVVLAGLRRHRGGVVLAFASALPVAGFAAVAYQWFPRYVLASTVPFLVLAAAALREGGAWLWRRGPIPRATAALAGIVLLVPALRFDFLVLTDPSRAPWPAADRFQFVEGWPSGYGWKEAYRVLREERERRPEGLRVMTDTRGHASGHWALKAYFLNDDGVEIEMLDLGGRRARRLLLEWVSEGPAYVATSARHRRRFMTSPAFKARRLAALRKPQGVFAGNLYHVTRRPPGPPGTR